MILAFCGGCVHASNMRSTLWPLKLHNSHGSNRNNGTMEFARIPSPSSPKASLISLLSFSSFLFPERVRLWMPRRGSVNWQSSTSRQRSHEEIHAGPREDINTKAAEMEREAIIKAVLIRWYYPLGWNNFESEVQYLRTHEFWSIWINTYRLIESWKL